MIIKKDLSADLGENAKRKVEANKKELFQRDELKLNKGKPKSYELFLDSYFDEGYIYLLMSQYDIANNKPINKIDIRCINASDLSLSSSLSVGLKSKEWLSNLCVRNINKESIFIVDISSEEGKDLYEIRSKK